MRIFHIVPAYHPDGPGGIEQYARALVADQRSLGMDVAVLTGTKSAWETPDVKRQHVDDVPVFRLHRDDLYHIHHAKAHHSGASRVIDDLFEEWRPDLVHVHHWLGLSVDLVQRARARKLPTVVTIHDMYATCPRCYRRDRDGRPCSLPLAVESCRSCVPRYGDESDREIDLGIELFRDQLRWELAHASQLVVAHSTVLDLLREFAGHERADANVLPLPFEALGIEHVPAPSPPAPGGALVLAHWGRLIEEKGVHLLVEAAARLAATRDVRLFLFGALPHDSYRRRLLELASNVSLHLAEDVDLAAVGACGAQLSVFPTLCVETHGMVLDEAFAVGLPVVASEIGAYPARIGAAGRTFTAGKVKALVAAIAELADSPAAWEAAQRAIPDPRHGREDHARVLAAVYDKALARGLVPSRFAPVGQDAWADLLRLQRESARSRQAPDEGPR